MIQDLPAPDKINAVITPIHSLAVLSRAETERLQDRTKSSIYATFRQCALAVLNADAPVDHVHGLEQQYHDFDIVILKTDRGIQLALINAPPHAFIDGEIIRGVAEMLFAVLRDLLYSSYEIGCGFHRFKISNAEQTTDFVFQILRNADIFQEGRLPDLVVCWGGHVINRDEYDYAKSVGYALGLYNLNICTGCGAGAMKAPMKGAAIAHAKQRITNGRYIGISEPGIIAAESPNPIVNHLVIMPDIEKRLEAFVRIAHALIIFPGGVGTLEELMYMLAILLDPENKHIPRQIVLTGPHSSADYITEIYAFIGKTLGAEAQKKCHIILGDALLVAHIVQQQIQATCTYLTQTGGAFYFDWSVYIAKQLQQPFDITQIDTGQIYLEKNQLPAQRAASLCKVFSAIVAGNVKEKVVHHIQQHGPFIIKGENTMLEDLDQLLQMMIRQKRMKWSGDQYKPCYHIER